MLHAQVKASIWRFALRRSAAIQLEQIGQRFLHREIVIVAHLGLAILQGAQARATGGEEQVGIRVPCAFQIGFHAGLPALLGLHAHGVEQPQLGQRRQPAFIGDSAVLADPAAALLQVVAADLFVDADNLQSDAGGGAEVAGGEYVASAQCQVVVILDEVDLDAGATGEI
ncbi:hypothetical protein D3C78_709920 [compost metagenome]